LGCHDRQLPTGLLLLLTSRSYLSLCLSVSLSHSLSLSVSLSLSSLSVSLSLFLSLSVSLLTSLDLSLLTSRQIEEHQYTSLVDVAKDLTEKAKRIRLLQEQEELQGLAPGSLSPIETSTPEEGGDRQSTMALIERDLPRTFPTLRFFHDGGSLVQTFSCPQRMRLTAFRWPIESIS
jgi:hypothetical protein